MGSFGTESAAVVFRRADQKGRSVVSERKRLEERFANNPEIVEETMEFMRAMGGASTIALAFLNKPNYSEEMLPSCIESVSAAMENMCLMAYAEGLGSCWVEAVCRAGDALHDRFAPDHGAHPGLSRHGSSSHQAQARAFRDSLTVRSFKPRCLARRCVKARPGVSGRDTARRRRGAFVAVGRLASQWSVY